ncbi:MAG: isoprenylcysteine carboxylmethyltransferase family protein [Rhizobiaceae bacterium]|nr:isoprenylcysteine carboxylmethyltransferase family protein [Rhizobiaceae bacterium]
MTGQQVALSRIPWPPLLYLVAIAVAIVLTVVWPLPWIGEPLSDLLFAIGGLLAVAAVAIFIAALRTLTRARTTVLPTRPADHLVTSGPFAISRNPIYLADTVLVIAIGMIAGSVWFPILAIVAAIVTTRLAIMPEERLLAVQFGKKYRDYAARVRRWL